MKRLIFTSIAILSMMLGFAQSKMPSYQLKDINGKTVNTAELDNEGNPVIVCFFATWCKPCQRELQAIHENYIDWQDETGVKVVAISIDQAQDANKVKPLVDGYGWEYDVVLDQNSDLKRALGINLIPYALVLDGNGNVVYTHTGYVDGGEEELIEVVRKYAGNGNKATKVAKAEKKAEVKAAKAETKTAKKAQKQQVKQVTKQQKDALKANEQQLQKAQVGKKATKKAE